MGNVIAICSSCTAERQKKTQERLKSGETLLGKYVKLGFTDDGMTENMWVYVTEEKGTKLVGKLSNIPTVVTNVRPGDKVLFKRSEAIQVMTQDEMDSERDNDR